MILDRKNTAPFILIPLLIVITLAVFWPVQKYGFLRYDDDAYVFENAHVSTGLTFANIRWAMSSTQALNWHPVTWLSHMLDAQIYGLDPGGHHRTSLLLHLLNVLLLYLVLWRMTGFTWRSGFVAALFAVHPLHVESVAWVAERKDLLSTFFMLLTVWAYARYAERPGIQRYLPVVLLYALGLMSKPMLVTLPLVLLLLDYWPLARLRLGNRSIWKLAAEKLPLFLLAGASGVVTIVAQRSEGAMITLASCPLHIRIENALVSYVVYIEKMFWPTDLASPYPYPSAGLPAWQVAGAALLLALVTYLSVCAAAKRPYLAVGWLWYLITLVPVIGLVQVGGQAMADRYTYIPLIGLFLIPAWGVADLPGWKTAQRKKQAPRPALLPSASMGFACVAVVALAVCAREQVGYWRNGITLYTRALAVTSDNYLAHNGLGVAYDDAGDPKSAIEQYRKALAIAPDFALSHYNLGRALVEEAKIDEAIAEFRQAASLAPDYARTYHNLAYALAKAGKMDEAVQACREAVRLDPHFGEAHNNLAVDLYIQGQYAEAWKEVYQAESCGFQPPSQFLQVLAAKMPPPGKLPQ